MKDSDSNSPSRLKKHLQIMGVEDHGVPESDLNQEKVVMNSIELPPLQLDPGKAAAPSKAKLLPMWQWGGLLAMAAAVAMVFVLPGPDAGPGWQIKGGGQIKVYFQRDGQVQQLEPGSSLQSGDQVRVELLSTKGGVAFLGVMDQDSTLLSPALSVWESRQALDSEAKITFSDSFELTDPSQGETVLVMRCPVADEPLVQGVLTNFNQLSDLRGALPDCDFFSLQLR